MVAILRRKLALPIFLAVLAAVVGGLAASLDVLDPVNETSASHSEDGDTYFRFLPPTGEDDTIDEGESGWQPLTCGWHWACVDPDDDGWTANGLDFGRGGGTNVYLRGHAYAEGHPLSENYKPVITTIETKPTGISDPGGNDGHTCKTVDVIFDVTRDADDADDDPYGYAWERRGRYRVLHVDGLARYSQPTGYLMKFSSEGVYHKRLIGTVTYDDRKPGCGWEGQHLHVAHNLDRKVNVDDDDELENVRNPYWLRNTLVYDTEEETENDGIWAQYYRNTDKVNWTHQLTLAGDPKALSYNPGGTAFPPPPGTGGSSVSRTAEGESTVSQQDARDRAEAAARRALPDLAPGSTITVTITNLAQTTETETETATRSVSSNDRAQAISDAQRAARGDLPSGVTGVTYSTDNVDEEENSITTTETRTGTGRSRSANRDTAIDTAQRLAVQDSRFGDNTPSCTTRDSCQTVRTTYRVDTEVRPVTTPVTAGGRGATAEAARAAAEASFDSYAEGRPGYDSHMINRPIPVERQTNGTYLATATGTVTWNQTQYVVTATATRTRYTTTTTTTYTATVTATGTLITTTYHATATATARSPNQAPVALASGTPLTVDGGGTVTLDGAATDLDGGTLTYAWTSNGGGTFADDEALDTTWTAPAATVSNQRITLTLTVTDPGGLSTTAAVSVTVRGDSTANRAPTAGASASATIMDGGGAIRLTGTASDPDGGTLSYEWTSNGGGTFADNEALSTTWTAPSATSSSQSITLTLTVTDSGGLQDSATVDVTVRASSTPTPTLTVPIPTVTVPASSAGNPSLEVAWRASTGGNAVTAYDIRYRTWTNAWTVLDDVWETGDGVLTYTLNDLKSVTRYEVQVRAIRGSSHGGWSSSAFGTTAAGPPHAPSAPTIGTPTATTLPVTWSAPSSNGGSAITGYDLQYGLAGSGSWTEVDVGLVTSHTLTNLATSTAYEVQVRARNTHGDGEWSASARGTAQTSPGAPGLPTNLRLSARPYTIVASWTAPTGPTVTHYDLRYRTGTDAWTVAADITASQFFITRLTSGTTYEVQLRAVNASGSSVWTASATATTTVLPDAPAAPTATISGTDLVITWTAAEGNSSPIRVYDLRHRPVDGSWTTVYSAWITGGGALTYTVSDIDSAVTYEVQVQAISNVGESPWSETGSTDDEAAEMTEPSVPAAPTVASSSKSSLSVRWAAPDDGGSAITAYDVRHITTAADETDDANWTVVDSVWASGALSYTITSLDAATSYDVQVRASNSIGDGEWSPSGTAVTAANQAPNVSVAGDPTTVAGGGEVTLTGTASDPDTGDTLTYAWSSDGGGTFADDAALSTTWTAPAATDSEQSVTLTLTVTDGDGLNAEATVAMVVEAAASDEFSLADFDITGLDVDVLALVEAGGNPLIFSQSPRAAAGTVVAGELGLGSDDEPITRIILYGSGEGLRINDSGPLVLSSYFGANGDGQDLSLYLQTEDDSTSFEISSALNRVGSNYINLDLPDDAQTLLATVEEDTRFIVALAEPGATPAVNRSPTATASGTPLTVDGSGEVTLTGSASDPDTGDTLTYAWTSDGGGTFADDAALSTTWTAPAATVDNQSITLTLTVTDGDGLSADATVAVTVKGTGTLYMAGLGNDVLYTVNPTTGRATRVGTATEFNSSIETPQGMAVVDGTLYLTDGSALYTVDTATGVATRVGMSTNFGRGESAARGLAAIGNTLYMVGESNGWLYTVDTTTGSAERVGNAHRFGVNEFYPNGLAAIGNTLYMTGPVNDVLYRLDATTGEATRVGTATAFGVGEVEPRALVAIGDTLYMAGGQHDALFIVDTATGEATRVGNAHRFGVSEHWPAALAYMPPATD